MRLLLSQPTPCVFSSPSEIKDTVRQLDKHKRKVKQGHAGPPIDIRQSSGGKATAGSKAGAAPKQPSPRKPSGESRAKVALEKTKEAWRLTESTGRGAFLAIDFEVPLVEQLALPRSSCASPS